MSTVSELSARFEQVRLHTEHLCEPLTPEDTCIQSMPDVSPPKWHLAHTTWFLENFLLKRFLPGYRSFHPKYDYLFNSYYETVGSFLPKTRRGALARPGIEGIMKYRRHVTGLVLELLGVSDEKQLREIWPIVELGINHEEQHQELLLMDIKHNFAFDPTEPVYLNREATVTSAAGGMSWLSFRENIVEVGHSGGEFTYDNERPSHRVFVEAFRIASRAVTNGEYLNFIQDRGYERPELWLSEGWSERQSKHWQAPLYWKTGGGSEWFVYALRGGWETLIADEPVCHVSYYEADAFARWARKRLPTEAEWEIAAGASVVEGNFLESERYQPVSARSGKDSSAQQWFGDVWEWTQSAYLPYPGFKPLEGSLGEYNGKFMINQMVLRGGSCLTPRAHIRTTYRNFYQPGSRWQISGLRLAEDV